jgi:hypothetical protein
MLIGRLVLAATLVVASVQLPLPSCRHAAGWSRHGLVERVMQRRSEDRALDVLLSDVVPEPVLARLVAPHDRMLRIGGMLTRMLRRRRVATTDTAAMRTAAQVEPPATGSETLDATRAARRYLRIDVVSVRDS